MLSDCFFCFKVWQPPLARLSQVIKKILIPSSTEFNCLINHRYSLHGTLVRSGIFMDATGSYDASFYLSGSLILLSAVICYPLKRVNLWETKKNADKISDDPS